MKRLAQLGVVLCLLVLVGAWTTNNPAGAGPAVMTAGGNQVVAKVKPICSVKDKCMFIQKLCVARCRCLNKPRHFYRLCNIKYRKCLKAVHTMECWGAAKQAELIKKYLKDCPKKPGR